MKLSINIRIALFTLLMTLFIISLAYMFLISPFLEKNDYPDGFWVTINGEVNLDGKTIDLLENGTRFDLPKYVRVYEYYGGVNDILCRSDIIDAGVIDWKNNTHGEYSITFHTPIEKRIIITVECAGCYNENLYVSKENNIIEKDLYWAFRGNCAENFEVENSSYKQITYLDNNLMGLDSLINRLETNSSNKDAIRVNDKSNADFFLNDAKSESRDYFKLVKALQSRWFYQRGRYQVSFREMESCYIRFEELFDEYNDSLCYIPDYETGSFFHSLSIIYSEKSREFDNLNGDWAENYQTPEELINQIEWVNRQAESLEENNWICDNKLYALEKTFEYQSSYCNPRHIILNIFQFSLWAIIFSISLIIGIVVQNDYKIYQKIDSALDRIWKRIKKWFDELEDYWQVMIMGIYFFLVAFAVILIILAIVYYFFRIDYFQYSGYGIFVLVGAMLYAYNRKHDKRIKSTKASKTS